MTATNPTTEAVHTPGPWFVLDQRATTLKAQGWTGAEQDALLISNYAPKDITPANCDCIVARIEFRNRAERLGEGNLADAHLIAAAPDLLEALEGLDAWTDKLGNGVLWRYCDQPVAKQVRAAIARARGEAQ